MSQTSVNPGAKQSILLIEDDAPIRRLLRASFDPVEFRLYEAETAAAGIDLAAKKNPDIILLDLGLPDREGISVIKTIRSWSRTPIIVVSGKNQEEVKVEALEAGADDYVTKPFGVAEVLARIRGSLRRVLFNETAGEQPTFEAAQLKLDRSLRRIWVHDVEVHLSPIEYKLLCTLVAHAGKVVTHRQLLIEVWGAEYAEDAQYLRIYIGYLRKKLEPREDSHKLLLTEPRVGYRFAQ